MSQNSFDIEPFFLDGEHGALFCIYHQPTARPPLGAILYLHPFAEEMHKSRRMAALQARRFAAEGYAVLQPDLTGCGDSAGDFSDASWETWLADARLAHAWLLARTGGPVTLWGLRTGAALAAALASSLPGIERLLLWQPVTSGELYLNQFLRIKTASEMLNNSQTGTRQLRARLDAGEGVEVGGYMLSPPLAADLSRMKLADYRPACPATWLETGLADSDTLAPAGQRIADDWRAAGVQVKTRTVKGEPFWLTQEITECPALLEASTL